MRNPRSARSGTALGPPAVSMIGSPSTMTATVDPVGATFSRRYGIVPRAYQTEPTARPSGPPGVRMRKSNAKPAMEPRA